MNCEKPQATNHFHSKSCNKCAVLEKPYGGTKSGEKVIDQVFNSILWPSTFSRPLQFVFQRVHHLCNLRNNGVSEQPELDILSIVKRTSAPVPTKAESTPVCEEERDDNNSKTWNWNIPIKPSSAHMSEKKNGAAEMSSSQGSSFTLPSRPSSQLLSEPVATQPSGSPQFSYHVCSRGRGAMLTLLVFISIFQMCGAVGQDRGHTVVASHFFVNIFMLLTFLCIWVRLVLARRNGRTLAQEQERDPPERFKAVYRSSKRCSLSLHPLPGSSCVCAMASPDRDSNSYVANLGFEPPERPLYLLPPQPRLPDPQRPQAYAVMATGDPTPEVGVRDQQALRALSELVIGGRGSEDPRGGTARTQERTQQSVSMTVSFPYEDSNIRSFNANAIEADANGDIVKDDNALPLGDERAQPVARHAERQEELVYPLRNYSYSED